MALPSSLEYVGEISTQRYIEEATQLGLDAQYVQLGLANMILEVYGKGRRRFAYGEPVAATAPECAGGFVRGFRHQDWIDGESVVQAGETTAESGFNARFHAIEGDLDALGRDAAQAFTCLSNLRGSLSRMLEEVRTELNRINADIHELRGGKANPPIGPVVTGPIVGVPVTTVPGPQVTPVFPWPVPGDPNPAGPLVNPVQEWMKLYGEDVRSLPMGGVGMVWTPTGRDDVGTIAGIPAKRLDSTVFNGQPVNVWSTPAGLFLAPATQAPTAGPERDWSDPRLEMAAGVASWAIGEQKELTVMARAGNLTVKALDDRFGTQPVGKGLTLGEALAGMAPGQSFTSVADLLEGVNQYHAERIVSTGGLGAATIATVGLNASVATIAEVPLAQVKSVPQAAREALTKAGIGSVGAMMRTSPQKLAEVASSEGVRITPAEAAGWQAMAGTLAKAAAGR